MATRAQKQCRRCGVTKPTTEYNRDNTRARDGLHSYCRECNKARALIYTRIKRYGVTPEMYAEMVKRQGGRCAICGTDQPTRSGRSRQWHVDHNHETGKVRGLLCESCNHGLGRFRDSVFRLESAIRYLEVAS